MKCSIKNCNGEIDEENPFNLKTGCGGCGGGTFNTAYSCKKCGRLHWKDGNPVFSRGAEKVFLVDGKIVHKR